MRAINRGWSHIDTGRQARGKFNLFFSHTSPPSYRHRNARVYTVRLFHLWSSWPNGGYPFTPIVPPGIIDYLRPAHSLSLWFRFITSSTPLHPLPRTHLLQTKIFSAYPIIRDILLTDPKQFHPSKVTVKTKNNLRSRSLHKVETFRPFNIKNSLTIFLWHFHNDAFDLRVRLQTIFTQFTADARHFKATERRLRFQNVVAVDPDWPNAQQNKKKTRKKKVFSTYHLDETGNRYSFLRYQTVPARSPCDRYMALSKSLVKTAAARP